MSTQDRRRRDAASSQSPRKKRQEVVYTQAKAFNRRRFLLQLITVVAVVLALLFGMSIFFKVDRVEVYGADKYTLEQIMDASGIRIGENLLTLNKQRMCANIEENLRYIQSVRVGRRLPGTVIFYVTELNVTYSIRDQQGNWWRISANGKVLDQCTATDAQELTNVVGVVLQSPKVGEQAVAYEPPRDSQNGGVVTVYEADKLKTALDVLSNMEKYGFIGNVIAKLDVSDLGNIQMWYKTRFQIKLGDGSRLSEKLDLLSRMIAQEAPNTTGILDASLTQWPDGIGKTDFPG